MHIDENILKSRLKVQWQVQYSSRKFMCMNKLMNFLLLPDRTQISTFLFPILWRHTTIVCTNDCLEWD